MSPRYAGFFNAAQYDRARDPDPAWRVNARCRGLDPEFFFPERGDDTTQAKSVCALCTVREPCGEYGMSQRHGIFGGMSEKERRAKRRLLGMEEPAFTDDDIAERVLVLAQRLAAMRLAAAAIQIYGHDSDSGAA